MANNHFGCVEHGKSIIAAYASICDDFRSTFEFVFKFQFRDLDTFIRKDMAGNLDIPLIKRFSETRLDIKDFDVLLTECRKHGFGTMVTPFDETSVQHSINLKVDYIKIASCSFGDWPLLEAIAKSGKAVIASCAGASEDTIDQVVSFFKNRDIYFLLQHCVGNYPTSRADMNVGQVGYLRRRYPNIHVGFSSHEDPSTVDIAPLALALGACSFEKHVALETEQYTKNKYSTSPNEFLSWLKSLQEANIVLGTSDVRYTPTPKETQSLRNLQRGLFARHDIKPGELIYETDFYYAFPPTEGQLTANEISKYTAITASSSIERDQPINHSDISIADNRNIIQSIAREVAAMVKDARVTVPDYADLEISHHYGVERFHEHGLTMITVINREYCKKILILLPSQAHPEQFHKKKEETFHVLSGSGILRLDGVEQSMKPGDVFVVKPGVKHHFYALEAGMILEEISSTHHQDDSYYTDHIITHNKNRKTFLAHWRLL